MSSKQQLEHYLQRVSAELDACVQFWLRFSHDEEAGLVDTGHCSHTFTLYFPPSGFYNCLSRDGSVYDTTKYCWLQGR